MVIGYRDVPYQPGGQGSSLVSRRRFGAQLGAALASLLVLPGMFCNKASGLISSLRGILTAVEHALTLLGALQGLLPETVNTAARYLLAVVGFVDAVGQILENDAIAAMERAQQILNLAADAALQVPILPGQVGIILKAVAVALDKFLSYFGTDQAHAGQQARGAVPNVPNMSFNQGQRKEIEAIEADARKDKFLVEDWQRKALVTPH